MKSTSRYLICIISSILISYSLFGQELEDNDDVLNQYELTCGECLELKERTEAGEKVARKEATRRLDLFVELNSRIKSMSLTSEQQTRFHAINQWFSTGIRPMVLDHESLPRITHSPKSVLKSPITDSLAVNRNGYSYFSFEKPSKKSFRTYLTSIISIPEASFGGMVGLQYNNWGGYIRFKGRFNSATPSYSCLSNGSITDSKMAFWSSGKACRKIITATTGILYGFSDWLSIYGGVGYGHSSILWEDIDQSWALVEDLSFRGVAVETGILGSWKFLTLGLGISTISFRTASVDISVGFNF